jgi:hypothetical protein
LSGTAREVPTTSRSPLTSGPPPPNQSPAAPSMGVSFSSVHWAAANEVNRARAASAGNTFKVSSFCWGPDPSLDAREAAIRTSAHLRWDHPRCLGLHHRERERCSGSARKLQSFRLPHWRVRLKTGLPFTPPTDPRPASPSSFLARAAGFSLHAGVAVEADRGGRTRSPTTASWPRPSGTMWSRPPRTAFAPGPVQRSRGASTAASVGPCS